jgi:hypothetical protein
MLDFPDLPRLAESFDTAEHFNVLLKSILNAHTLCYTHFVIFISLTIRPSRETVRTVTLHQEKAVLKDSS